MGHPAEEFQNHIFKSDFDSILTGREDLRDRVATWARITGFRPGPDELLDFWFRKADLPDPEIARLIQKLSDKGIRQVIATNNEFRRADYIEDDMGFGERVEKISASGRLGLRKPDPAFFTAITDNLRISPDSMLLIDDCEKNVAQASASGWTALHFTQASRGAIRRFIEKT